MFVYIWEVLLLLLLINYGCSVYGRGRKLDKVAEILDTACSLGVPLDEKAYMKIISYYGKAGNKLQLPLSPISINI